MRIVALIFAVLFILSAVLQYNDPDPWLWIFLYGIAAVFSFLFFRGVRHTVLYAVPMLAYLAGAVFLWPEVYKGIMMKMSYAPEVEEARESLGLGICAFAMLLYWLFSLRRPGKVK